MGPGDRFRAHPAAAIRRPGSRPAPICSKPSPGSRADATTMGAAPSSPGPPESSLTAAFRRRPRIATGCPGALHSSRLGGAILLGLGAVIVVGDRDPVPRAQLGLEQVVDHELNRGIGSAAATTTPGPLATTPGNGHRARPGPPRRAWPRSSSAGRHRQQGPGRGRGVQSRAIRPTWPSWPSTWRRTARTTTRCGRPTAPPTAACLALLLRSTARTPSGGHAAQEH